MSTFLYRLGRFSYRRRWVVVSAWAAVLLLAGVAAAWLSQPLSTTFTIPGTESQQALDLLDERMPGTGGATARVVFVAPEGHTVAESKAGVEATVQELSQLPDVAAVNDPFQGRAISQDGRTALATVTFTVPASDLTADEQTQLLAVGDAARQAGLTVDVGGDAATAMPTKAFTETLGVAVAAVVLVITFGSLLAAGLPLVTALVGVGLGAFGIGTASHFTTLSSTSGTLATMLGLAVAVDYALFIVSRHRHELLSGHSGEDAAGRAVGTAGSAVVFAGATVVIALAALSVVGIPFLTSMGLAAAATVAGSVVIALTLLPALLGFLGDRVLGRKGRAARDTEAVSGLEETGARQAMGTRWANFVVRRPVTVLVTVVVALGALAIPALALRLGMPSDATAATDSTQRRAYEAIADGFGPGMNGPLLVVTDLSGATDPTAATQAIQSDLATQPGVAYATPPTLNPTGDLAIFTVIPTTGPDDQATEDLVHAIRGAGWQEQTGAPTYVTGATAVGIDISQTLQDALLPYLAVVVGLAFLLLLLVFRSLVVPLKATLGFLLSMAATLGAVVAVFQKGWGADLVGVSATGPILSFLPILMIGLLFGLAMDYEVFLVTRMREEHVHGASAREAVVRGFGHGARVVTAAAIIMISVFAGFALADETIIKSLGFALAVGIFFDAFLVRMAIVPAVMALLGERAWALPGWLDRILPDVDVEGDKLTRMLAASEPAREPVEQSVS